MRLVQLLALVGRQQHKLLTAQRSFKVIGKARQAGVVLVQRGLHDDAHRAARLTHSTARAENGGERHNLRSNDQEMPFPRKACDSWQRLNAVGFALIPDSCPPDFG